MNNDMILGASMIVGMTILYIFALSYVENKIRKQDNKQLEENIDKLDDKTQ